MTKRRNRKTPERTPDPRSPQDAPEAFRADGAEDDADDALERGPLRRCLVTRARAEKAAMIRFVVGPEGAIVADLALRLPGRGMWLSARQDVLKAAAKRGVFAHAAKRPVSVPSDLAASIAVGLRARIGETLGLARRAGQAVAGFDKAREWLLSGRAGLVVAAHDGSAEERARFLAAMKPRGTVAVVDPLSGAELGRVFARERVVHVALVAGRLAAMIAADTTRLAGIEGRDVASSGDAA
ncbi:MAG: RNA-binding protein [Acidibrevibacterium sp.]|uniref:RNA-binding protein n=1 Tax=Acidibrevibacterium sp. TaxID=2606776 RepID=UPI003CFC1EC7